ncbi:MAG: methyl-accepting chemotaxis protein [Clostridia bacterium]|nr:methyl-accepting chemotaxis protein [Clostridia bacterium]
MKKFYNLKIGTKLLSGFIVVAIIAGIIGIVGIVNLKSLDDSDTELYQNITVPLSEVSTISTAFQRLRVNVRDMLLAETPEQVKDFSARTKERVQEIEKINSDLKNKLFSPDLKTAHDTFQKTHDAFIPLLNKVILLAEANKDSEVTALIAEEGEVGKASRLEQNAIDALMKLHVEEAHKKSDSNTVLANNTSMVMIIFILLGILFAIGIGIFLTRLISRPVTKLVEAAEKLSVGDIDVKIESLNTDEIGLLMSSFGKMIDNIKEQASHAERIANGELNIDIIEKSKADVLSRSMQKVVATLNDLISETGSLTHAAVEGRLDTRGNTEKFKGGYKEIVEGLNKTLDAVIGPLNVAAEYVDRISKGDIPLKITDTYRGDFNEIKNNINLLIENLQSFINEMNEMSKQHDAGDIDVIVPEDKFQGTYKAMAKGVNDMVKGHITVKKKAMACVAEFAKGNFDAELEKFPGKKAFINENIEGLRKNIKQFINEMNNMSKQHDAGDIDVIVPEDKFQGSYKAMAKGVNDMVKGHITVKKKAMACVAEFAKGNFDAELEKFPGKKAFINENIEGLRKNLKDINLEISQLITAASAGKLSTRAHAQAFKGDWAALIAGLNGLIDAIIEPVKEASSVLKEMAKGNLKVSVTGNYMGDHAEIKDALNSTINTLNAYIFEISSVLSSMSEGNLDIQITGEYMGNFIEIKNSLNQIINSLNDVLSDISTAADQVAGGSRQVSDSSQALSQGSTEQASSIEELTSSMTQIAAQTKQNAVNANQANELAELAKTQALQGNDQMKGMLKAMEDINQSSSNISKIIKVIDEIAFQTNILALNAAVEAARAGQHGKGFAVVAEEVRNLAARSANAAKETTVLIEGSIGKVEDGTVIANETAKALTQIVDGIAKAASLVGNIAAASNEQATGISQVNQGISQVSQVTQTNSATAQESAAASEELSGQAELLKDMVSRFKLRRNTALQNIQDLSPDVLRMLENASSKRNMISTSKKGSVPPKFKISLDEQDFGKY